MALFGTCLGRPWGCRAFAIKMRRFLRGRWLLRYLFFWIFFRVYTFLKSLLDIIWAWGKMTNGKEGDRNEAYRLMPQGVHTQQVLEGRSPSLSDSADETPQEFNSCFHPSAGGKTDPVRHHLS